MATAVERRLAERPRVESACGRLDVAAPVVSVPITSAPARRVHRARLHYSRWRLPARVTLEIERWSADACEVLLRPQRRVRAADGYFAAACAVLDTLRLEVEAGIRVAPEGAVAATESPLRRAS